MDKTVTISQYRDMLAEFHKNLTVSGFFGSVDIRFTNGKANVYQTVETFRQKDLEANGE